MKLRDKIINVLRELGNNGSIECVEFGDGDSGLSIDTAKTLYEGIQEVTGIDIDEKYIEVIQISDGFHVFWKSKDDAIFGEFHLSSPSFVLMKGDTTQLWNDTMSEEEINIYKEFQTIDIHHYSGDGQYSALRFNGENSLFETWFINRDAKFKLELDYRSYFNTLIETRGLHGWQYFYLSDYESLKESDYDLNRAKGFMENTLQGLKKLFPEVDIQPYQMKYDNLFN